jgi:hypothetical protein
MGTIFRTAKIFLCKMSAAQEILAKHSGRDNTACLADLLCPYLGTGKKKKTITNIFSQEVWFHDLMLMG